MMMTKISKVMMNNTWTTKMTKARTNSDNTNKLRNNSNKPILVRLMKCLNGTKELNLTLSADNLHCIKWYVDASFAAHPDYKSHTGASTSYGDGDGAVQSISRNQKLNTKSSTESKLIGVDNVSIMIFWTKLFLEEQGYEIKSSILYQDNKSAVLLETNGKKSSGKRTRALNICYFFLTHQVEKGNLTIVCISQLMIWSGTFIPSLCKARRFTNSETRFLDV
jgi:hypothetical protein